MNRKIIGSIILILFIVSINFQVDSSMRDTTLKNSEINEEKILGIDANFVSNMKDSIFRWRYGFKPINVYSFFNGKGVNYLRLRLFVKDTGKGIPTDKLKIVFDRFRKTEEGKTKLYSGTGLGLSLVKGLIEFMNGTVTVETKTKKEFPSEASGTKFTVVFKGIVVE